MEVDFFLRDLEGADPSPRPERVAALTECAQRFAGEAWRDKVVVSSLNIYQGQGGCLVRQCRQS